MKFEITVIDNDEERVSTQEFDADYWYDALDHFVGQLKLMGWIIPKNYIRVHDFDDEKLSYSQNVTQGFDNED